jgi:pyruvate,water dikinase
MEILWLGDPACRDRALAGGKAAHLSRLAAGYRVPAGFCLTTVACDRAMAGGDLEVDDAVTPARQVPPTVYQQLAAAYRTLAERCGEACPQVAVRSSAMDEDSSPASFAGQHETYLNMVGEQAVAAAVVRCWVSALAPRALAYRRRQGLATERVRLAVLVQRLVAADVSAVVFSANPLTGNRDEVVITASWGLGESIVGGTVTPDTYAVRKVDLVLFSRQIADKGRMTVLVTGGTRETVVPRCLRRRPALDEGQVVELARLAMSLERTMGWPVDVECAYQAGIAYLLQCRPITTLPSPSSAEAAVFTPPPLEKLTNKAARVRDGGRRTEGERSRGRCS